MVPTVPTTPMAPVIFGLVAAKTPCVGSKPNPDNRRIPSDQLRRNNWETQKIRESEIGNIIANHKNEINDDIELDIKKNR